MKITNKEYYQLITLAMSAKSRKETLDLLYEAVNLIND